LHNNEEENSKAMGILKGCTQMKQIKVAFNLLEQLKREKVKIAKEVWEEVLKCAIACADITKAS